MTTHAKYTFGDSGRSCQADNTHKQVYPYPLAPEMIKGQEDFQDPNNYPPKGN